MLKKQLNSIHHSSQPMEMMQNNSEMEKKMPAFHPTYPAIKKKQRTARIVLRGADRLSGSLSSAQFYVQLPDTFISKRLKVVVESFLVATAPLSSTNLETYPYCINIRELKNPYSYESTNKGTHGIIACLQTRNFQNASTSSTACSTLVDRDVFQRPITIDISSTYFDVTAANGLSNGWTLVLAIVDEGDN